MNTDINRLDDVKERLGKLDERTEAIQCDVKEIKTDIRTAIHEHSIRLSALEQDKAARTERWKAHAEQHARENRVITAIAAVISSTVSGIIAWFKK